MAIVYKYRVYCSVESKYYTIWLPTDPTVCPNDGSHAIDTSKTSRIDIVGDKSPTDPDGKFIMHNSTRPPNTHFYFSSRGDDPTNVSDVGGGNKLILDHQIGDTDSSFYIDFNTINNKTFLYEGSIQWTTTNFDELSIDIVPRTVVSAVGTNTNYNETNGYLVTPAAGNGTLDITSDLTQPDGGLIYIPNNADTGLKPMPCYFNATWNNTTKLFENITAVPDGSGDYNIFTNEITFSRYLNYISLLGDGNMQLNSTDSSEIGHGMRMKVIPTTHITDHDWKMSIIIKMFRNRTS